MSSNAYFETAEPPPSYNELDSVLTALQRDLTARVITDDTYYAIHGRVGDARVEGQRQRLSEGDILRWQLGEIERELKPVRGTSASYTAAVQMRGRLEAAAGLMESQQHGGQDSSRNRLSVTARLRSLVSHRRPGPSEPPAYRQSSPHQQGQGRGR